MTEQEAGRRDKAAEANERNVAQMREVLDRKHEQERRRRAEPPLTDDHNIPAQENRSADDPAGTPGSGGGIRNMGGGRP